MIEELKTSLAREKIKEFLDGMQKLGFEKEEAVTLITEVWKGEEK